MDKPDLNYPNRVNLSKVLDNAHWARVLIDSCLENTSPDDDLHYEFGPMKTGPYLETRIRLFHFLQMTLPGKPCFEELDEFRSSDSEFDPDNWDNFVDHLAHIRRTSMALAEGDYYSLRLKSPSGFGFVRQTELQRMVVMVNCSNLEITLSVPALTGAWIAGTGFVIGSGESPASEITLGSYEGRLFESRKGLK
jgi:hypothetical protein